MPVLPPLLTDTTLALAIGGIGLLGVLVGAALSLFGTLLTTSRQIDRQERDARRAVYATYLESALRADDLLTDQRRAFVEANDTAEMYYHFLDEARDPANAASVGYIRLQADKQWTQSDAARKQLISLQDEFRLVWREFTSQGHRLKIHAPAAVHDAAGFIYDAVGVKSAFDRSPHPDVDAIRSRSMQCFSALARADSQSPDAPSWRRAESKWRDELAALGNECRRLREATFEHATPEFLRPLLPVEELEAP